MDRSLSGKWVGYYQYGFGYDLTLFGKKVKFELRLTEKNGSISGVCIEEKSEISMKKESLVKGFLEDNLVSFIKIYPGDNFNDKIEIEYLGEIDANESTLFGKWIVTESYINENLIPDEFGGEGIWILKKENNEF